MSAGTSSKFVAFRKMIGFEGGRQHGPFIVLATAVRGDVDIDAAAGKQIDIRTDNYLGGSEPNVRAVYTTRDGFART